MLRRVLALLIANGPFALGAERFLIRAGRPRCIARETQGISARLRSDDEGNLCHDFLAGLQFSTRDHVSEKEFFVRINALIRI